VVTGKYFPTFGTIVIHAKSRELLTKRQAVMSLTMAPFRWGTSSSHPANWYHVKTSQFKEDFEI